MTIRVFLLNGHELVREGLRAVLGREDDMEVVGEADSAVDGLHWIEATRPDVVIADLLLSDSDGLDVCRRVKERAPGVACLILDTRGSDTMLLSAIRANAAGLLLTHTTSHELRRMIRFVATGSSSPNPIRSDRPTDHLNAGTLDAGDSWELPGLTPQERRLLDHLAEGLTNPQIAARMDLAEKTVKNYVSNLLRKLNMRSRTEAAVFVTNLQVDRERCRQLADGATAPA